MVPNLEEGAIAGAVRIWNIVGSMEVGFIWKFTSQSPIGFLDWLALRRVKIPIPILPMKSADQIATLRSSNRTKCCQKQSEHIRKI